MNVHDVELHQQYYIIESHVCASLFSSCARPSELLSSAAATRTAGAGAVVYQAGEEKSSPEDNAKGCCLSRLRHQGGRRGQQNIGGHLVCAKDDGNCPPRQIADKCEMQGCAATTSHDEEPRHASPSRKNGSWCATPFSGACPSGCNLALFTAACRALRDTYPSYHYNWWHVT